MADITYTSTSPAGVPDGTKQVTDEHVTRGHMPIVKIAYSAIGGDTLVTADASGLLVNLGVNNDVTVTGTVTANTGLSQPLTDVQLRASAVPVSGPLTDVQLRATAVPISGALTDAQIRATPLPVSGIVTATGGLTDTQLRASPVPVDGSGATQPVSAAALPLPSGAATAANQATEITSLQSIDTKAPALGQALAAASVPVVLTAAQLTTLTPVTSITANAGTNLNTSLLALESGGNLATLVAKDFATQTTLALVKAKTDNIPALGQALAAASVPIVLTASQLTTLTPPAAITGFATSANQATEITALGTLLTTSNFDTKVGSLTETAPATDTASSGQNGRLQRVAQRLTSMIALLPAALGQGTMAQSLRVVLPSDQSTLPMGGNVADDAVDSGNPVLIGASAQNPDSLPAAVSASDRAKLVSDLSRRLIVYIATAFDEANDRFRAVTEGYKTTYSASFLGLAPAITATDILEIIGSATKTVRILRIQISGVATAAGAYTFQVVKRSTAATGGSSTSATIVPHDSTDAAGTIAVKGYTANPTLGTGVGTVRSQRGTVSTAAGAIPIVPIIIDFTTRNGKGIVLRGVTETLCLNLNGVTMTGGLLDIDVEASEE